MITVRRSGERRREYKDGKHVWHTFYREDQLGLNARCFSGIERLDEEDLPARSPSSPLGHGDEDVLTYVCKGAIAYVSSTGHTGLVHAGDFQRVTTAHPYDHRDTNASHFDSAHLIRIALRGEGSVRDRGHEEKRFSVAERRGQLRIVASPDGRRGSLHICQDACVYSGVLEADESLDHTLAPGRSAWIHVVQGDVLLQQMLLSAGDGAGIHAERVVSIRAQTHAEVLLLDVAMTNAPITLMSRTR